MQTNTNILSEFSISTQIFWVEIDMPITCVPYSSGITPLSLSNCSLWLDAADSTTITGTTSITAWRDKSGNANNAIFSGTNPSYVSASNAVITANANQTFTVPAATLQESTGSGSLFFVYGDQQTGGSWRALWGTANPGERFYQTLQAAENSYAVNGAFTPSGTVVTALATTNTILYNMNYTYGSSTGDLRINGTTLSSSYQGVPIPSGDLTISGTGWGVIANVRLYEVISYKGATALTTSQQQQIEGYLAQKWGLTSYLPGGHPGLTNTYYTAPKARTFLTKQVYASGAPTGQVVKFMSYLPKYSITTTAFYNVSPDTWTNVWQPYLTQLAAANSGATASISTYSVSGSTANYSTTSYGALAPNGLMYFIGGTGVFVLNPATNTATILGSVNTGSYSGLVLGTNGNLYGIPYGSGTVLVITPSATSPYGTVTTIGSGIDAYQGGCLGANGTIYALPWTGSNILTINTTTNTATQVAISPYCSTRGSVLGPDGNIYGCPWGSSAILKINTSTNTSSTIGCDGGRYWGCCLAPNGLIYFSPFDAGHLLSFNVFTNSVTTLVSISNNGSCCVVVGPNGKLYITGYNTGLYEYNYNTNTYATIGSTAATNGSSINLAPNGNLYIPGTSATLGYYVSFASLSQLPNSNYCLSAYANKF